VLIALGAEHPEPILLRVVEASNPTGGPAEDHIHGDEPGATAGRWDGGADRRRQEVGIQPHVAQQFNAGVKGQGVGADIEIQDGRHDRKDPKPAARRMAYIAAEMVYDVTPPLKNETQYGEVDISSTSGEARGSSTWMNGKDPLTGGCSPPVAGLAWSIGDWVGFHGYGLPSTE
jgi:hypothetical protein